MITPNTFSIENLINLTGNGMQAATFAQIRSVLIAKYKEIYGSDIDLSTGNADGEYVNSLSLLLNNILRTMEAVYGNLDVNTASGKYLDALCALSNVRRKPATKSVATIQLEHLTTGYVFLNENSMFQDQAGNLWNYIEGPDQVGGYDTIIIKVESEIAGPVKAPASWINTFVGEPDFTVTQENDAIVGENEETDSELRNRRNKFVSSSGQTVLESMNAALLDIAGIKDVKIYNSTEGVTADDGTVVPAHSIYAIIRQTNVNINVDNLIGNTIYQKLTPGINTTQMDNQVANGIDKSLVIIPNLLGQTIMTDGSITQTIYWKLASPMSPTVTITYDEVPNSGFLSESVNVGSNTVCKTTANIFESVKEYLNNLAIGVQGKKNDVIMAAMLSDEMPKGFSTITNVSCGVIVVTNDGYYEYTEVSESVSSGTHTVTIS